MAAYKPFKEALAIWKSRLEDVPPRTLDYKDRKEVHKIQGPRPEGVCKFCAQQITSRRTTFCNNECKKQYFIACNDEKVLPMAIFARDRGICCVCNVNVDKFHKLVYSTTMENVLNNLEKINYIFRNQTL